METSWQDVKESGISAYKKLKAFLRDKLTDKRDLSAVEIDYDFDNEEDFNAFRQETKDKSELDIAIATYVDQRLKSIEEARNRKRRKEQSLER